MIALYVFFVNYKGFTLLKREGCFIMFLMETSFAGIQAEPAICF